MPDKLKYSPPDWADRFLEWYCADYYLEEVQGDLYEWFLLNCESKGVKRARFIYWLNVLGYFSISRLKPFQKLLNNPNYLSMKSLIKITYRNLRRDKISGLIRVGNLTLGIGVFLLALVYSKYELSYDEFHDKGDQIFRLGSSFEGDAWAATPMGMGPFVQDNSSEVIRMSRLAPIRSTTVSYEDKIFYERNGFYGDSSLFQMFSFDMLQGDPKTALIDSRSIVLTESMARKYFGAENPMGKRIELSTDSDREGNVEPRIVTGIMADLPEQSHIQLEFICSIYSFPEDFSRKWYNYWVYTYVELPPGAEKSITKQVVAQEFAGLRDLTAEEMELFEVILTPIKRIHLYTNHEKEYADNGNIIYIYILFSIGVFVLLISSINFINLTVIKGLDRAKEVGLRKVVGASRYQLVAQFLGENGILLLFSGIVCLVALAFMAPIFQQFSGLNLPLNFIYSPEIILVLLLILISLELVSGLYPALVLSQFRPADTIKSGGHSLPMKQVGFTREVLMVTQFCISIVLVIGSIVVYDQLRFIQNQDLGFEKDQIVHLKLNRSITDNFQEFENELLQITGVKSISTSSAVPGYRVMLNGFYEVGVDEELDTRQLYADETFLETFGIELLEGRHFNGNIARGTNEYMLNQRAASEFFGERRALNQQIVVSGDTGLVVGIVDDFNFQTLHNEVEALTITNLPIALFGHASIKYEAGSTTAVINAISDISKKVYPDLPPLEVEFLDARFEQLYLAETKLQSIVWIFCLITILLTISGIFGVASYNAHKRAKEIAIRKVLGGDIMELLRELSKSFVYLLSFALIIGLPGAYFLSEWWLQDFAYQVRINPVIFILAGFTMLMIIAISSGFVTMKAATSNPADVLKSE